MRGMGCVDEVDIGHASEVHRLKCRIIELEAVLRDVAEYADIVGSETDEVHIAVILRARATLAKGPVR